MVGFPSGFGIAAACMAEVEFLSSISLASCHSIFYEKVILTSFTSTSFEVIALNQKKVGMGWPAAAMVRVIAARTRRRAALAFVCANSFPK